GAKNPYLHGPTKRFDVKITVANVRGNVLKNHNANSAFPLVSWLNDASKYVTTELENEAEVRPPVSRLLAQRNVTSFCRLHVGMVPLNWLFSILRKFKCSVLARSGSSPKNLLFDKSNLFKKGILLNVVRWIGLEKLLFDSVNIFK